MRWMKGNDIHHWSAFPSIHQVLVPTWGLTPRTSLWFIVGPQADKQPLALKLTLADSLVLAVCPLCIWEKAEYLKRSRTDKGRSNLPAHGPRMGIELTTAFVRGDGANCCTTESPHQAKWQIILEQRFTYQAGVNRIIKVWRRWRRWVNSKSSFWGNWLDFNLLMRVHR